MGGQKQKGNKKKKVGFFDFFKSKSKEDVTVKKVSFEEPGSPVTEEHEANGKRVSERKSGVNIDDATPIDRVSFQETEPTDADETGAPLDRETKADFTHLMKGETKVATRENFSWDGKTEVTLERKGNFFGFHDTYATLSAQIREVFSAHDTKGDHKIAAHQISTCLRALHLNPSEALVAKTTHQWANNPDARISVEDFIPVYDSVRDECSTHTADNLILLDHLAQGNNGTIHVSDLRSTLENSGEKLAPEDVDFILSGFHTPDGLISIKDLEDYLAQ